MARTITRKEFLALLDELFGLAPGTLTGNETLADYGWDSLRVVEFMSLIDSALEVSVSPPALANCKSVDDLAGLISERIIS